MRILVLLLTLTGISGLPGQSIVRADADPEQVRAATESGQIRPLSEILRTVERRAPGKVLDIQVDDADSPWLYRVKVRGDKGDVKSIILDAETGEILEIRGQR
jgi:uncharacterized membrane protein YkoI